jgi:hypothetical protein
VAVAGWEAGGVCRASAPVCRAVEPPCAAGPWPGAASRPTTIPGRRRDSDAGRHQPDPGPASGRPALQVARHVGGGPRGRGRRGGGPRGRGGRGRRPCGTGPCALGRRGLGRRGLGRGGLGRGGLGRGGLGRRGRGRRGRGPCPELVPCQPLELEGLLGRILLFSPERPAGLARPVTVSPPRTTSRLLMAVYRTLVGRRAGLRRCARLRQARAAAAGRPRPAGRVMADPVRIGRRRCWPGTLPGGIRPAGPPIMRRAPHRRPA